MAFVKTDKPNFTPSPGWEGKFFHSENMSFMDAAPIPDHQHPNAWNILEGSFEVTIDSETRGVGPGDFEGC